MTKRVAVVGDVTATPSTVVSPNAAGGTGTWQAGTVSYTSYPRLKVESEVIWKARCTFSFSGSTPSGTAVTDSETVTLTAGTTKLMKAKHGVLVDGDAERGAKGNRLEVHAGGTLVTD